MCVTFIDLNKSKISHNYKLILFQIHISSHHVKCWPHNVKPTNRHLHGTLSPQKLENKVSRW